MSFYVLVLHKLRRKSQKEIEMRNLGKNSQKPIPLRAISYSTTVWTILSNCARLPFCLRFHQQLKYVDKSMMSLQNFYTINFFMERVCLSNHRAWPMSNIQHSFSFPRYKWWCHFDDDVYVNLRSLLDVLNEHNPSDPVYIGKTSHKFIKVKVYFFNWSWQYP